ncbi:endonuclease/exonuclease/phosphatase family protein [Phaeobacter sp. B1627]|uniref:endonuclease/exonuclease/phosphatase family protein n=1 Tax=Phaeobacter sp. B1627 TaxID=2583809 RepID=UPI00111ABCB9|nr:endonuclease/exonuclease/phosphatase family protein [Phaeobacter sp. B1627]TNJ48203.1 endonuclease [Phaeobacter sp. B1627]
MRLSTYNIEWFANLFDARDRLFLDGRRSGRHGVSCAAQTEAIATVLRRVDADAIVVIEAPNTGRRQSTLRALAEFADWAGLRTRAAVMGFSNETQQEIAFLFDPDVLSATHAPVSSPGVPAFDGCFSIDLDVDAEADSVRFSKPPMEIQVTPHSGPPFRLIGAHLKSKAPHGARSPEEARALSISNRRKQLAQAIWLRARMTEHLNAADPLVVMGDLNDGPGLDEYEALFGRSSVEIILGAEMADPHARCLLRPNRQGLPTSARFYNQIEKRYFQALLDYAMISPDLARCNPRWRIWHPFEDAECYGDAELRRALLEASDHFPVSLDLDLELLRKPEVASFGPQTDGDPL